MAKFSKQFGGWATKLKFDIFYRLRFRLTIVFIIGILVVAGIFYLIEKPVREQIIRQDTLSQLPEKQALILSQKISNHLNSLAIGIYFTALMLVIMAISYLLVNLVVQRTRKAIEGQKRFIADAAHEFRTPLSIIKTNSEVALLDGAITSAEATAIIKDNIEEIDRMSNILSDLLDLTRLQSEGKPIYFSKTNLNQAIHGAVRLNKKMTEQKKINLLISGLPPINIWGNLASLEKALDNILKNAIFHTPANKRVVIWAKKKFSTLEIYIRDSGPGIAAEDLPCVFEPFYKANKSQQSEPGQTGLGLTIAREIIKQHKGSINIISRLEKGTLFIIKLPTLKSLKK